LTFAITVDRHLSVYKLLVGVATLSGFGEAWGVGATERAHGSPKKAHRGYLEESDFLFIVERLRRFSFVTSGKFLLME
jgi:hypothetical protein